MDTTAGGRDTADDVLLEAREVGVRFGGVDALIDVTLTLQPGEILGLIGPNGAGKTTLVNVLTAYQRPTSGTVSIGGRTTTGLSPDKVARLGIARTFQSLRLFGRLSVFENVEVASVAAGMRRRSARRRAWDLLDLVGLAARAGLEANSLPHGDEQKLSIARALAGRPRFLLLDEPSAGLNDQEGDDLIAIVRMARDETSCGVLVIEHDMRFVMELSERVQVLNHGRTLAVGTPNEVQRDSAVIDAYLGSRES